ncbi:MAG: CopD family protein [Pseudomonadota bacterium]
MIYLAVKSAHIVFVVAWMASLLIYPRYKIHQLTGIPGGELALAMSDASTRLRRIIMTPAMLLVWGLGITMIVLNPGLLQQGWLHAKIFLLVVLSGIHGWFVGMGRKIDNGQSPVSAKTLRMINEAPFLLMIVVVVLAITKPF